MKGMVVTVLPSASELGMDGSVRRRGVRWNRSEPLAAAKNAAFLHFDHIACCQRTV